MSEQICIIASKHTIVNHSQINMIHAKRTDMKFINAKTVNDIVLYLNKEHVQFLVFDRYIFGLYIEEAIKKILGINPRLKIFCVMNNECERFFGIRLMRCGCDGIIYDVGEEKAFIELMHSAFEGRNVLPENIREAMEMKEYLFMPDCVGSLTKREIEVLFLMVGGKSIKEICLKLKVKHGTVASLRSRLMKKMGALNSIDTVRIAYSYGYLNDRSCECF